MLRGHKLDSDLIMLILSSFDTIRDFLTNIKYLRLQLKLCGIYKDEKQLVLSILSKLGPDYSTFISTFYATNNSLIVAWKIPYLDNFVAELTREEDKLVKMGAFQNSKACSLALNRGTKVSNASNKIMQKPK